jgi:DNA-binding CsgD family transcriptional regulator
MEPAMTALILGYLLTTLLVGVACSSALLMVSRARKDGVVAAFLPLYAALGVLVVCDLMRRIWEHSAVAGDLAVFATDYGHSFVGRYAVMLALPLFAHRLFGVRRRGVELMLLAGVAAAFAGQHVTEFMLDAAWDARGDVAEDVLMAAVVSYTVWTARMHWANAADSILARRVLVLLAAGVPGIAYDLFLSGDPGAPFYPILYGALSVAVTSRVIGSTRKFAAAGVPAGWDLTGREKAVLGLVYEGLSTKEIARDLTISPNTVKAHLRAIFDKTGFRTRMELLARGNRTESSSSA